MSLETIWRTIRWENQVFGFILDVIEVNTYLAMRYFGPLRKHFCDFRNNLAFELVFNELYMAYGPQDSAITNTKGQRVRHELISAPPCGKFENRDGKKDTKQNINNFVAAQEIAPTGAVIYSNVTRITFYTGHILVNTLLRKLQSFRSLIISSFHFFGFLAYLQLYFLTLKFLSPPRQKFGIVKTVLVFIFQKHCEFSFSELLMWN